MVVQLCRGRWQPLRLFSHDVMITLKLVLNKTRCCFGQEICSQSGALRKLGDVKRVDREDYPASWLSAEHSDSAWAHKGCYREARKLLEKERSQLAAAPCTRGTAARASRRSTSARSRQAAAAAMARRREADVLQEEAAGLLSECR